MPAQGCNAVGKGEILGWTEANLIPPVFQVLTSSLIAQAALCPLPASSSREPVGSWAGPGDRVWTFAVVTYVTGSAGFKYRIYPTAKTESLPRREQKCPEGQLTQGKVSCARFEGCVPPLNSLGSLGC